MENESLRDRIVVASSDSRFLRVASFLLDRAGLEVSASRSTRADDVSRVVERARPCVVVLDGDDCGPEATGVASLLKSRHAAVHVLLVANRLDPDAERSPGVSVLSKWSFRLLRDEIERLRRAGRPGDAHALPAGGQSLRVVATP